MMRRWKAIGKALAGFGLAVSVSACSTSFLAGVGLNDRYPGSSGLVSGQNPASGGGQGGQETQQPSFVALYPTSLGPMLYKDGKLYSLASGTPKEWGKGPREGMAWSIVMLSAQEGWGVGSEGIARYRNQVWEPVVTSSHELLSPASNQGAEVHLTDVAFADAATGYAVGTHGTVLRYKDGAWKRLSDAKLAGKHFGTVRVVSPSEVWVSGEDVLCFDGSNWQSIGLPPKEAAVSGLLVLPDALWASTGDALWRYDRTTHAWTRPQPDLVESYAGAPQPVPGTPGSVLAWAMDVGTPGGLLYRLGSDGAWERVKVAAPPAVGLDSLVMQDADTGYALSFDGFSLYRFVQGTWSKVAN